MKLACLPPSFVPPCAFTYPTDAALAPPLLPHFSRSGLGFVDFLLYDVCVLRWL